MCEVVTLGSRCVRGPDWQWKDQDGGIGHVGTVVVLGQDGHSECPTGTIKVVWDTGAKQNYRAGYGGKHDLLLLDNGPSGTCHPNFTCSNCGALPIFGLRWSCSHCGDIHLCTYCYMGGSHRLDHSFVRYSTMDDSGIEVKERAHSTLVETWGTFPGATVARGPDWRFGNQDGGPGTRGVIRDLHDWSGGNNAPPTARSVVSVVWPNQEDNMYSRGHKGMVHVQSVVAGRGGRVYMDHLPIMGLKQNTTSRRFLIGQYVMVNIDIETLKHLQVGNGGFNPSMIEVMGKRGRVHRITEKGLVRVQFPGNPPLDHRWAINPAALRVLQGYKKGDVVKVTSDRKKVEKYHNPNPLESVMGLCGTINLVHSETSYVIDFGEGKVATLHPGCFETPVEQDDRATVNKKMVNAAFTGDLSAVGNLLTGSHTGGKDMFVVIPDQVSVTTGLHHAAGKGHLQVVVTILKYRPALVNEKQEDKTALQIASHEGHTMVVDWLLQLGAHPDLADQQGDTALHYAAIGSKPDTVLTLVNKGANVNSVNKSHRTAVHIGVVNRQVDLVRALVKVGADVNIQDSEGDSPFHLSIVQGDQDVIDLLMDGANMLICNRRGHNPLHIAAVKGDVEAIRKILRKDRAVVNIVTLEGKSALHMAYSTPALVSLIKCPQADINISDVNGQTVLHQVASRLDVMLVKLMVDNGAKSWLQDTQGNTPAHLVLVEGGTTDPQANLPTEVGSSLYSNQLEDLVDHATLDLLVELGLGHRELTQIVIVCYLLSQMGSEWNLTNLRGESVVDLVEDVRARRFVQDFVIKTGQKQEPVEHEYAEIVEVQEEIVGAAGLAQDSSSNPYQECKICSESTNPLVTFLPCGHQVSCPDCSTRIKKCLQCGHIVEQKVENPKKNIPVLEGDEKDRVRSLEVKMQELEDQFQCTICMERRRNVAFLCGHGACGQCSEDLSVCHMCRSTIDQKIALY